MKPRRSALPQSPCSSQPMKSRAGFQGAGTLRAAYCRDGPHSPCPSPSLPPAYKFAIPLFLPMCCGSVSTFLCFLSLSWLSYPPPLLTHCSSPHIWCDARSLPLIDTPHPTRPLPVPSAAGMGFAMMQPNTFAGAPATVFSQPQMPAFGVNNGNNVVQGLDESGVPRGLVAHFPTSGPLKLSEYRERLVTSNGTQSVYLESSGCTCKYAYVTQRGYYPEVTPPPCSSSSFGLHMKHL